MASILVRQVKAKIGKKKNSAHYVLYTITHSLVVTGQCITGREVLFEAKIFSPWNLMSALFFGIFGQINAVHDFVTGETIEIF